MTESSSNNLSAILLAAGQGTRMRSERPKPLHRLCGQPMLAYVLESLGALDANGAVIVVGHKGEWVTKKMQEIVTQLPLQFVEQRVQRGTGDAVMVGLVGLSESEEDGEVLVLPGDTPLLQAETLAELVKHHRSTDAAATVLTAEVEDPSGYGRIVRAADGAVTRIVEHRDAGADELALTEVNTSIYCFRRSLLSPALRRVEPDNSQGEYYLTDVIDVLVSAGHRVEAVIASDSAEISGVNDRLQLAQAESELRRRTNDRLMRSGVTMVDPLTTYVDTTVEIGKDVTLFPGAILSGETVVGDRTEIGSGCRLVDTRVGADCVLDKTVSHGASIAEGSHVGPYAHLGPGAEVSAGTSTGPFFAPSADRD